MRLEFGKYYGASSIWDMRYFGNNDHVLTFRICLGHLRFYIDLIK